MRHRIKSKKLGRSGAHRKAMLANMVSSLINEKRITTTLQKARLARSMAEKMVTIGRRGTLADRRRAIAILHQPDAVGVLFSDIVPRMEGRHGGYTRIYKLGRRSSDSSEMAILEWVEALGAQPATEKVEPEAAVEEAAPVADEAKA